MAVGIITGLLCSLAATWMFTQIGKDFFPLTLTMWPGALVLGAGMGWLAGRGRPIWLVILAGGLIPFGNTILTSLLVGFLQIFHLLPGDNDWEVSGLLMIGFTLFGPALAPFGLASGLATWLVTWGTRRFLVRA